MSRGDHVYIRRNRRLSRYSHHGIDCGDGTVIHYDGGWGTVRRVERTSWDAFSNGSDVFVRQHRHRLPVEEIVAHAESRLGAHGYHLVRNNCEHFATWASTGSAASSQVRRWAMAAPAVTSIGVGDAAGVNIMLLGSLGLGVYALANQDRYVASVVVEANPRTWLTPKRRRGSELPRSPAIHERSAPPTRL